MGKLKYNLQETISIEYMAQFSDFLNGKKILIYHINSRVPLRRDQDLDGINISVINGNGVLNKVLKQIKDAEVNILVTIGIPIETVKLIEVAINKSQEYIILINHELKGNETRESFLGDLESMVMLAEGGSAYRINQIHEPILSLNPGEAEAKSMEVSQNY